MTESMAGLMAAPMVLIELVLVKDIPHFEMRPDHDRRANLNEPGFDVAAKHGY